MCAVNNLRAVTVRCVCQRNCHLAYLNPLLWRLLHRYRLWSEVWNVITQVVNKFITTCTSISLDSYKETSNVLRRGADKSLARPTSRSRRTESRESLEKGFCSCAELQVVSVTEAEMKHVTGRARFQQHRDASCRQVFFPCKARCRRKFTPFW